MQDLGGVSENLCVLLYNVWEYIIGNDSKYNMINPPPITPVSSTPTLSQKLEISKYHLDKIPLNAPRRHFTAV
jgi:hypothetical protein